MLQRHMASPGFNSNIESSNWLMLGPRTPNYPPENFAHRGKMNNEKYTNSPSLPAADMYCTVLYTWDRTALQGEPARG